MGEAHSVREYDVRSEASTDESVMGMLQNVHEADAKSEAKTAEHIGYAG